jgi:hypothetical protein
LAHRFLAAFDIFALPAADNTRFLIVAASRFTDVPKAIAAACNPLKSPCNLANCFFTLFSSRRIAAKMLMDPPETIYLTPSLAPNLSSWVLTQRTIPAEFLSAASTDWYLDKASV